MENIMAKWKTTMDTQKERHKQRNLSSEKQDFESLDNEYIKLQAQKVIDIIAKDQDPPSCNL